MQQNATLDSGLSAVLADAWNEIFGRLVADFLVQSIRAWNPAEAGIVQ